MAAVRKCLELGVVGLGQAGSNLAIEFDKLGYQTLVVNTSFTDLRGISLTSERSVYIGLDGRDGAGQDVQLGSRSIDAHAQEIVQKVGELTDGCDHILLCAGLGGGTGSNVAALAGQINRLGRPVSVLCTLPKNQESSIVKINAVNAINAFRDSGITSIILVDNEKILRQFRSENLIDFYHRANNAAVSTLHEMNSVIGDEKYVPVRGFDGEDFRRVFSSRGVLIYGMAELAHDDLLVRDRLAKGLRSIWDSSGLLASGFDYKDATMAGALLVAPRDLLDKAPADVFEMLVMQIRDLTETSGIYTGLFQGPPDQGPRLYTMLGGLPFPERLRAVLEQAKEEGSSLGRKVGRPFEELDVGDLRDLDLFGGVRADVERPAPVTAEEIESIASGTRPNGNGHK